MRDILLVSVVIPAALVALKRPWVGVMLWTWLSLMNPHRYTWGFAYYAPLAAIAAGATLTGLVLSKERQSPFGGGASTVHIFVLFTSWITTSWLFGMDIGGDYDMWSRVLKIFLMTFVALILLDNKQKIHAFVWVNVISLGILGVKGGVFTVLSGGSHRVWGPAGSFIEDNNAFSVALIMVIPVMHYLYVESQRKWQKLALVAAMLLCAASAVGSYSRGGFLAIAAMGAVFWWRGRHKLAIALLILIVTLAIIPMMPETWWARMESISEYQSDGSAQGRLYAWGVAWKVALHHFSGGGMSYQHPVVFALYGNGADTVIAAHSIYFQILGNHGFVGFAIFVALWFSTYRQAGWLRKIASLNPQAKWAADLGGMVQVALVGYAVGGAFLSIAYFDLPYNLMVMVVLSRIWVQRRGWENDPEEGVLGYLLNRRQKHIENSTRSAVPVR